MSFIDTLIAEMSTQEDEQFQRAEKESLKMSCEWMMAQAAQNCVWVKYNLHGEVVGQHLTRKDNRTALSRVDVNAEPTMYIPSNLFRDLLNDRADRLKYPYRLKDAMDALQATRAKKVMGARLEPVKRDDGSLFQQQRVVIVPLVPFFVGTGIDPREFYPEETHDWRYINY